MKSYEVSVPVMGIAHLTIEAENEADALSEALDTAGPEDVDEWQAYPAIVEGNIFFGPLNRARIDNVYDPEAE